MKLQITWKRLLLKNILFIFWIFYKFIDRCPYFWGTTYSSRRRSKYVFLLSITLAISFLLLIHSAMKRPIQHLQSPVDNYKDPGLPKLLLFSNEQISGNIYAKKLKSLDDRSIDGFEGKSFDSQTKKSRDAVSNSLLPNTKTVSTVGFKDIESETHPWNAPTTTLTPKVWESPSYTPKIWDAPSATPMMWESSRDMVSRMAQDASTLSKRELELSLKENLFIKSAKSQYRNKIDLRGPPMPPSPNTRSSNMSRKAPTKTTDNIFYGPLKNRYSFLRFNYSRPPYFPWRTTNDECKHYATRYLEDNTGRVIALASFPGSGNTWLRYIIETVTGCFTGSYYMDANLISKGFWGELDSYLDGTTIAQKTHNYPVLPEDEDKPMERGYLASQPKGRFKVGQMPRKVILLLRSPYESILALRHYHSAGHTGFAPYSAFQGPEWDQFVEDRAPAWLRLNIEWLSLPNTRVLVVHYENLVEQLEKETIRIIEFLGITKDYGRLHCLLRYSEGRFRRPRYPRHLQGYHISGNGSKLLSDAVQELNSILIRKKYGPIPTHLYNFIPPTKVPANPFTLPNLEER